MPIKHVFQSAVTDSGVGTEVSSSEWNDDHLVDDYIQFDEASTPSTPSSGFARVYAKSDGRIYSIGDDGIERGPFDMGAAPAGYPVIAATATTSQTTNSTSHTVNVPSTSGFSGQLLLMLGALDGTATISATGWTVISSFAIASTGNVSLVGMYRFADGSEASTIAVTSSASEKGEYWVARIQYAHASTPPEGASIQSASAAAAHNPPSLTPSWGSAANLWFAMGVADCSANAAQEYLQTPIFYSYTYSIGPGVTDSAAFGIVQRYFTGTVLDPGALQATTSEQYCAGTVAIRPA